MKTPRYFPISLSAALLWSTVLSLAQTTKVVEDHFDTNKYGWSISQGANYDAKIEGGKFILNTYEESKGRYFTLSPYFDKKKDFVLQATFTQQSGSDNNGFGLLWGLRGDHYHTFVITTNGYYQVIANDKTEGLNEWVDTDKIKPMGQPNTLRVEYHGGKLSAYLNGDKVIEHDALMLFGNGIGIINYTNMVLEVDDFEFRQDVKINLPTTSTGLVKENLGPKVNSTCEDLAPKITADGRMIYFGREDCATNIGGEKDGEDVWYTELQPDGTWGKSQNIGRPINNENANNLAAVSSDNNTLMFNKNDGFVLRRRIASGWSDEEYLNVHFDNESANMESTLSADGKAILFTVKLKSNLYYNEKIDEKDLYVSLQGSDGQWSDPINLGPDVNTPGNELGPFLAADGKTLYFSTDGLPGFGNQDVFYSKRLDDTWKKWSAPVNMGPDINTFQFDAYYNLPASGDYAYMSTAANSIGSDDIIRIKLPQQLKPDPVVLFRGRTLNSKSRAALGADIIFENLQTHEEAGEAISDPRTGEFSIVLPYGYSYGIRAVAEGYLSLNENLDLSATGSYSEIQKDLLLAPIEVGQSVPLNNVFFIQSKAILKPESYPELDRLAELLVNNPRIEIELSGHTDNRGDVSANFELSDNRVKTVMAYLVSKGVSRSRLNGKGYGGTRPLVPNDTDEHRQMNRRVEFKITKK